MGADLWRKTDTFWLDWRLSQRNNLFIYWFSNYFLSTYLMLGVGENRESSLNLDVDKR